MHRNVVVGFLEPQFPGAKYAVQRMLKGGSLVKFDRLEEEPNDKSIYLSHGTE